MSNVVGLVLPFFGLIFLGFLIARIKPQPSEALGWMNTFVVYLALPAFFFQLLAKTPFEQLSEWRFIAGSVLSTYIIFALMFVFATLRTRGNVAESTVQGLAAAYGNIGYMGPGLALLVFGEQAAVPIALIFCFENIMHFTIVPLLMALSGERPGHIGSLVADVIKKIVLHPFIIATAAGVAAAFFEIAPPQPIEQLLDYLARAAAPCALFAMGVTLALRPIRRMPVEIVPITFLKLLVHPALCYVVISWVGDFSPDWILSAVLLAALPTATNVFVMAQQYGVWIERATASVLVTTVVSVASVTVILYLITSGLLPPDLFPNQ